MSCLQLTTEISIDKMSNRLDTVLAETFNDYSRSRIQTWIKEGRVTLDGEVQIKPKFRVLGGEKVVLNAVLEDEVFALPENIPIDIV